MPPINKTSTSKVLVTGVTGYIAMWIARTLLERGYSVRGTVRTEEKGKRLIDYFRSIGYGDKFELAVVEDMQKEGAFDDAVKGVNAIEHCASPFAFNPKEPEDIINPAVQGTRGILESALKYGSEVERIVITSSVAAIITRPVTKPTVYTEEDWDSSSVKVIEEMGSNSPPAMAYYASKTLAEKAAWDFYEQHKHQIKWDITTILPAMVFGPYLIPEGTPLSSMGAALEMWHHMVVAETPKTKESLSESQGWVDVRDTALGHVLAIEKDAAGGQRIFTVGGRFVWQEWTDAANSVVPGKYHRGFPEITQGEPVYTYTYDNSKQAKILGINYRTIPETTKDILESFSKSGL